MLELSLKLHRLLGCNRVIDLSSWESHRLFRGCGHPAFCSSLSTSGFLVLLLKTSQLWTIPQTIFLQHLKSSNHHKELFTEPVLLRHVIHNKHWPKWTSNSVQTHLKATACFLRTYLRCTSQDWTLSKFLSHTRRHASTEYRSSCLQYSCIHILLQPQRPSYSTHGAHTYYARSLQIMILLHEWRQCRWSDVLASDTP